MFALYRYMFTRSKAADNSSNHKQKLLDSIAILQKNLLTVRTKEQYFQEQIILNEQQVDFYVMNNNQTSAHLYIVKVKEFEQKRGEASREQMRISSQIIMLQNILLNKQHNPKNIQTDIDKIIKDTKTTKKVRFIDQQEDHIQAPRTISLVNGNIYDSFEN